MKPEMSSFRIRYSGIDRQSHKSVVAHRWVSPGGTENQNENRPPSGGGPRLEYDPVFDGRGHRGHRVRSGCLVASPEPSGIVTVDN